MICFHFTIFVVLGTTGAFATNTLSGCDLLSFYYLCRTRNNSGFVIDVCFSVVICFHFTIFVVLGTTVLKDYGLYNRCDLLSFYYLCRTRNNPLLFSSPPLRVVICFHFTIFVVLGTTQLSKHFRMLRL